MRPLRLTLDGFRSYASATTFDFAGRRLVGIVGPIGSGKSTILDGIAFALYGKTHTLAAATKTLIHQRAAAGKVELVFEADGAIWRVVRALRRDGQSEHAAYRYEDVDALDAEEKPVERVLKKGEVDARIEEVIGLDFAAFGRSVMLAQNRFAEFLRAKPADRDVVLKGVFGFERIDAMALEARRRRDELARDLEEIERRQKDLDNERALLVEAEQHLKLAARRHEELAAIATDYQAVVEAVASARRAKERHERRLSELDEAAARLPDTAVTEELLQRAAAALGRIDHARSRLAEAEATETSLRTQLDELMASIGGPEVLRRSRTIASDVAAAEAAVTAHQRRVDQLEGAATEAAAAVASAEATHAGAVSHASAAARDLADAERTFSEVEGQLRAAQTGDAASALRSGLVAGEPCPVCEHPVAVVPEHSPAAIEEARIAYEAAHAELDRRRAAHGALAVEVARAEAALAAARRNSESAHGAADDATSALDQARQSLATLRSALAEALDGRELTAVETEVEQAQAAVDTAGRTAAAEREAVTRLQAEHDADQRALENVSGRLASLAGYLGLAMEVPPTPEAVADASEQVTKAWKRLRQQEAADLQGAVATVRASEDRRQDLLAAVNLPVDAEYGQALSDAKAAEAARKTEVATRAERIEGAADLARTATEKLAAKHLYTELAADLTPSNFLRFLLEEERRHLSRLGSERFEELSGGRYRFSDDGQFRVVDLTAAEQDRKADTLSGGETFLASLALALALAETVGRGGGRLDAFFIDEGFGSLDSEHLDLAMAGIEHLVAGHDNRLVVVVSHVPDMRERIEDLIELDKDPATGATLVRRA